jgi:hypothetical protein
MDRFPVPGAVLPPKFFRPLSFTAAANSKHGWQYTPSREK